MQNIQQYNKAIAAAVSAVAAVIVAIVRGESPETIPGAAEALTGAITILLVYLIPNKA